MSAAGTLVAANSNITAHAPLAAIGSQLSAGERTTFGRMAGGAVGQITNEAQLQMFIQTAIASAANMNTDVIVSKEAHFNLFGQLG